MALSEAVGSDQVTVVLSEFGSVALSIVEVLQNVKTGSSMSVEQ